MIRQLIRDAEAQLQLNDLPSSYAKFVMNELLAAQGRNLYLEMNAVLDDETRLKFLSMIHELSNGRPLAYVLGYQSFYGYKIYVNEQVLIPRFETEELVMRVLQGIDEHFSDTALTLLDVATGSGAIACALKCEMPSLNVLASDISTSALTQAQHNARQLKAPIEFFQGDMLQPFIQRNQQADVIVCNPPYIPQDEVPEASVLNHEPHLALFGGVDGLKFYRQFFEEVHQVIRPHGLLAFEMGYQQREDLVALAKSHFPNAIIEVHQDLQQKDRILLVYLKPE